MYGFDFSANILNHLLLPEKIGMLSDQCPPFHLKSPYFLLILFMLYLRLNQRLYEVQPFGESCDAIWRGQHCWSQPKWKGCVGCS